MNKQKIINTLVDWYEKAEQNIKNADKLTLWIVIVFLLLANLLYSSSKEPKIIINIPKVELPITHKSSTHTFTKPSDKSLEAILESSKPSENDNNPLSSSIDSRFKYCYFLKGIPSDDPFDTSAVEDMVVFVLNEKINTKGETYVQTVFYSDYSEEYIKTSDSHWYRNYDKVECSADMIKKHSHKYKREQENKLSNTNTINELTL